MIPRQILDKYNNIFHFRLIFIQYMGKYRIVWIGKFEARFNCCGLSRNWNLERESSCAFEPEDRKQKSVLSFSLARIIRNDYETNSSVSRTFLRRDKSKQFSKLNSSFSLQFSKNRRKKIKQCLRKNSTSVRFSSKFS